MTSYTPATDTIVVRNSSPTTELCERTFEEKNRTRGAQIQSIFDSSVSDEERVEQIERLEYESQKEASTELSHLGDQNRYRCIYPSFDLHYLFQQIMGHSAPYAKGDDYRGTWNYPISEYTREETEAIALVLNRQLITISGKREQRALSDLITTANRQSKGKPKVKESLLFFQRLYLTECNRLDLTPTRILSQT